MTAVTQMLKKKYLYSHGNFTARKIGKIGFQDQLNTCSCRMVKKSKLDKFQYLMDATRALLASYIARTGNGRKNVIIIIFLVARNYLLAAK